MQQYYIERREDEEEPLHFSNYEYGNITILTLCIGPYEVSSFPLSVVPRWIDILDHGEVP